LLVSIIGGAGRMGSWFAKYFLNRGYDVAIFDVRADRAEHVARSIGARVYRSSVEAAGEADILLIATPIDVTPKVICEVARWMRRNSILIEISSLKSKVMPVLRGVSKMDIRALSIHPLFGSGAQGMAGEKIALIPVNDPASEEELARRVFPEANIITVDLDTHDRVMALTLSLTHFVNIIFASIVGEEDVRLLKHLGGTTFSLQLIVSEAVMSEDPSLYASIQMTNEHTVGYIDKFLSFALELRGIIESRDVEGFIHFYRKVLEAISKDEDFGAAYGRMYRALKAI